MTTPAESTTTESPPRFLTPAEIGCLVKALRNAQGWVQETLADLSGLQTRTIQRVEQGQPTTIDTRRALARAFRLEDIDYFNSPKQFPSAAEIQKQKEVFDREHVLLDAQIVNGRQLLIMMQGGTSFTALSLGSTTQLQRAAQDAFASIADFVGDCLTILDDSLQTEILGYGDHLDDLIAELGKAGSCLYAAFRQVNLAAMGTEKPKPLPVKITYLLAVPKDRPITKVAVTRKGAV